MLTLATPIIGENLLQTAVGAVDTFMVARLGAAAVAGVGTGFELVFFIISILSAIDIGATVLVSQAIGAGDRQRANHWPGRPSSGADPGDSRLDRHVRRRADDHRALRHRARRRGRGDDLPAVTAATSVALFLSFVCGAVLRGAGDSRTPLPAAMLANVVNVVVAYVLIFGHFGSAGAGCRRERPRRRVRSLGRRRLHAAGDGAGHRAISLRGRLGLASAPAFARQLLTLGVPAAVEQVLSSGAFMVLIAVVALIGTDALAAQQITFTALSLAFLPAFGFSIAATALVGQSIGARHAGRREERVADRAALGADLDGNRRRARLPLQRARDGRFLLPIRR